MLILELNTEDVSEELESVKQQLIQEKRAKVMILEELLQMYSQKEKLINDYRKLQSQFYAISHSKLGKLTYIYWRFLKRIKRGKKNANT